MKKFKFLLLALAVFGLFSFVACNNASKEEATEETVEQTESEPTLETDDSTKVVEEEKN
jgi:hypothetical protein